MTVQTWNERVLVVLVGLEGLRCRAVEHIGVAAHLGIVAHPIARGRRAGPGGIFPFGLGRQPVGFPRLFAQPRRVFLRIVI